MDKGYKKERFITLKIKRSVAVRFRRFCKKYKTSQSLTLDHMMEFFDRNGVTPKDRLGQTITSLKGQMSRRFNAIIAIIRDIEKGQTKPTLAMLQALFEQHLQDPKGATLSEEDFDFLEPEPGGGSDTDFEIGELTIPKIRYDRLEEKLLSLQRDFEFVLTNIQQVHPPLGKSYLKVNLTQEKIETYKRTLKNL
ncbi:hypothetical protein SAMN04487906_1892 [Zhouia amylolytica]|uniref:Uncharacterized protein n=1 Tax=Zhouia amylolytica TaxID=376730 RepID=A0A1I6T6Z4_9FLAO|nr:BfmA/BtgA family mobilization protein [Zhouia amylolytica]SFS85004.1 hypothetical protein SAMN04487906_1892 [Zhouia amylolytica]